jgi:hypothetical protein
METHPSKNLLAFISTVTVFFCLASFSFAQASNDPKHNLTDTGLNIPAKPQISSYGYFCRCGVHGYGCNGNHSCINYCTMRCNVFAMNDNKEEVTVTGTYHPELGSARILLSLNQPEKISIKVFDKDGQVVETLAAEVFAKGEHELVLNIREEQAGSYSLQFD